MNSLESARVLVTGAGGFLGGQFMEVLRNEGCQVYAHCRSLKAQESGVLYVDDDLLRFDRTLEMVKRLRPDYVVNFAGVRAAASPGELAAVNVGIVHNLLQACASVGVQGFVQIGSSEEYGDIAAPFVEGRPVRPRSNYGRSKLAATLLVEQFACGQSVNATTARVFLAYGSGQGPSFFLAQLLAAYRQRTRFLMSVGNQLRDFIHVDDVCEALLRLLRLPKFDGVPVNLCSGRPTRLWDLVECFGRLAPEKLEVTRGAVPYRTHEIMENYGDPSRMQQLLGFLPAVDLENGLARLIASK